MIFEREAVIHDEGGIHARVAAMIVQRAQELCERYDCHSTSAVSAVSAVRCTAS